MVANILAASLGLGVAIFLIIMIRRAGRALKRTIDEVGRY